MSLSNLDLATRPVSLTDRVVARLRTGATVESIAVNEGISSGLAQLMVDELRRLGVLMSAESLCASGLGACGGADNDQVRLHCAGCPLSLN